MNYLQEIKPASLVYEAKLLSPELCDRIITQFEADSRKAPGLVETPYGPRYNPKFKNSLDISITGLEGWEQIDRELHGAFSIALKDLIQSRSKAFMSEYTDEGYKVKKTFVGDLSFDWHTDVDDGSLMTRQVALIAYLNDVEEGGGTEFLDQGIYVKPEKGKIVLFPPFWTHLHKGHVPISNDKYIVTTFLRFKPHG